ncbi:MAG: thioesterase family protein, partial [Ilumatobacteraceae bacterium]|nr:thioesterase family protein [Ilumatobacteraceae bacterium]
VVGDRPIRTVTTSFLRPAFAKPATVSVDVVRAGRSITNLAVTLTQSAKVVVISHVIAAEAAESTAWDTATELDLVPIEQCVPIAPPDGIGHFAHGVAMLDPADLQCRRHRPGEGTDH